MKKSVVVFASTKTSELTQNSALVIEEEKKSEVIEDSNTSSVESSSSLSILEAETQESTKTNEIRTSELFPEKPKPAEKNEVVKKDNTEEVDSFMSLTDAFDLLDEDFFTAKHTSNSKKTNIKNYTRVKRIPVHKNSPKINLSKEEFEKSKQIEAETNLKKEDINKNPEKENSKTEKGSEEDSNSSTLLSYASEVIQTLPDRDVLIRIIIAAVAGIAIFFTIFVQLGLINRH